MNCSLNYQNSWITGVWLSGSIESFYSVLHRVTLVAIQSWVIPLVVPGSNGIWTVDGYLVIVGPQAMSVSVRVRE